MSKIVAIAGLGDDAPAQTGRIMLVWGVIIGVAASIFVGTLMIKPGSKRRA